MAVVVSEAGAAMLAEDKTAKDFISDAFGHGKFIAYNAEASLLFERAGLLESHPDEGVVQITEAAGVEAFVDACAAGRVWNRELKIDLDAAAFIEATRR